jgi:hypothetical protein
MILLDDDHNYGIPSPTCNEAGESHDISTGSAPPQREGKDIEPALGHELRASSFELRLACLPSHHAKHQHSLLLTPGVGVATCKLIASVDTSSCQRSSVSMNTMRLSSLPIVIPSALPPHGKTNDELYTAHYLRPLAFFVPRLFQMLPRWVPPFQQPYLGISSYKVATGSYCARLSVTHVQGSLLNHHPSLARMHL